MAKDKQLVTRRIFSDKGDPNRPPLREGLVPLSIPNERSALLAYWEKEDAIAAEKEAQEAAEALQAISQPPAPSAEELVAPLAGRLDVVETSIGELQNLKLASTEEVLRGTQQIARGAGMAAEVEAVGLLSISKLEQAKKSALALFNKLEGSVKGIQTLVNDFIVESRESLNRTNAEMVQKTTSAISKRITKFELDVAKLKGPKGSTGGIGIGMVCGVGPKGETRPDGSQWRVGDSYLRTDVDGLALQYLGPDGWSKAQKIVPEPRLINATQNVLDMAPRQSTTIVQSGSASSGGGGQERLMTSRHAGNVNFVLADSSNYGAAGQLISGGELILRLVSETTGQSGLLVATFNLDGTNRLAYTSFSELGDLYAGTSTFSVDLTGAHQPPTIPAGITPSGFAQQALVIKARINGPGTYQITGGVSWALKGDGIVVPKGGAGPQPAWVWA